MSPPILYSKRGGARIGWVVGTSDRDVLENLKQAGFDVADREM